MAGAGIRALGGGKPLGNKALSAAVTARAEQASMMARSGAAAAFMGHMHARARLENADTVPVAAKLTGSHAPVVGKHGTIKAGPLSAENPHGKPGTIMAPAAGSRPLNPSQKITSGANGSDSQKLTLGALPASPATGAQPAAKNPTGAQPKAPTTKAPAKQPVDRHVGITERRGPDGSAVPTEVRVLGRKGDLFMHTSRDGKGFAITHGPSGKPLAEVDSKAQARAMMNGMAKGKTVDRALAGDKRAIDALRKYGARVMAAKPAVKPIKPPKEAKPPREAKGPRGAGKGHGEGGSKGGHGGKIHKADFSGIVHPFKAAASVLPHLIQSGIGTAQALSGLAAVTAASHRGRH